MRRRNSMTQPPEMSDVKIMLLGSTGAGKSASGNTIIGVRGTFKEDLSLEETRFCDSAQTVLNGQSITVIDTVGLSDTSVKITDAQTQIEKMLQGGVDVFLLVIKLGETFTETECKVVKWIQDNFGAKFSDHAIVLFTHGDQLRVPIEDYLGECESLRSVVDQCSGGFHVFNNKDEDPSQVTELLDKINTLREKNGDRRYTEQDYKETQDTILLRKCRTGAAVGAAAGGVAAAAAAIVGAEGGLGGAASGGAAVGAGAAASKIAAVAITVGKVAVIGAAGGAALAAAAVGAGVYLFARKYKSRGKDKSN